MTAPDQEAIEAAREKAYVMEQRRREWWGGGDGVDGVGHIPATDPSGPWGPGWMDEENP